MNNFQGAVMKMGLYATMLFVVVFVAPIASAAADPSCSVIMVHAGAFTLSQTLSKDTVTVKKGEPIQLYWLGANADIALDSTQNVVRTFGITTVVPQRDITYTYTFRRGTAEAVCSIPVQVLDGSFTTKDTIKKGDKVTLSGTAQDIKKVRVVVYPQTSPEAVYTTKALSVKNDRFTFKMPKALSEGAYRLVLQTDTNPTVVIATSSVTVGTVPQAAKSNLVVRTVPLLSGGTAKVGSGVAVAYLQVINVDTKPTQFSGFTFTQQGSAPTSAIVGVSINDELGIAKGSVGNMVSDSPFTGTTVTIPVPVTLAAKESRLFTIRAVLSPSATVNIGQTLSLALTALTGEVKVASPLPLPGVVWTIGR